MAQHGAARAFTSLLVGWLDQRHIAELAFLGFLSLSADTVAVEHILVHEGERVREPR